MVFDLHAVERVLESPITSKITSLLLGIAAVLVVAAFVRRAASATLRDADVRYRARKLVDFASYAIVILVVLTTFGGELTGLTVAMGGISVGVGLALQELVVSFAGWLAVSAGGFYRVGDRVQLGGIKGDVIDISILRTTVMECGGWVNGDLYNGRVVRIANSFVFKEPVFNYSADFPFLWDEITVPVKYGCDRKLAREILERVAQEVTGETAALAKDTWSNMVRTYRIEDARVDPFVTLIANDNWLEYTVRYVTPYLGRRRTKDLLFNRIMDEIDATAGAVAMASMTVHLVEIPPLDLKLPPGTQVTIP